MTALFDTNLHRTDSYIYCKPDLTDRYLCHNVHSTDSYLCNNPHLIDRYSCDNLHSTDCYP